MSQRLWAISLDLKKIVFIFRVDCYYGVFTDKISNLQTLLTNLWSCNSLVSMRMTCSSTVCILFWGKDHSSRKWNVSAIQISGFHWRCCGLIGFCQSRVKAWLIFFCLQTLHKSKLYASDKRFAIGIAKAPALWTPSARIRKKSFASWITAWRLITAMSHYMSFLCFWPTISLVRRYR